MKKTFFNFLIIFCAITTGITLVVALAHSFYNAPLAQNTLWHILLSSLLTSLATSLCFLGYKERPWERLIRSVIHYFLLCLIMVPLSHKFNWCPPGISGVLFIMGCVAAVYAFVLVTVSLGEVFTAKKINNALLEKFKDTEE